MRTFLILMVLIGCGDDGASPIDAAPDVAVVSLDCSTYCTEIQVNCIDANAQYLDMAHCTATCASFTVGTSKVTDTSGNTLGCRIHYAGNPAITAPATNCVHAGPAGGPITATPPDPVSCIGNDVCASFCALEIKACGSLDAPLPGNPRDADGNPLFQYLNMANCMSTCAGFDKMHAYSTAAAGNSLACRLYHATNAAIAITPNGEMHCSHTAANPTGPCAGTAMP